MLGHEGAISVACARHEARKLLTRAARGEDPAGKRAETRRMPKLEKAFEDLMDANPKRAAGTARLYREEFTRHLADWRERPLDDISRRDVEARFNRITEDSGWSPANRTISLLRSIYRRPCVDFDGLRNPVDLWLAGGGKFHRNRRRKISTPEEVLPRWKKGVEEAIATPCVRDAFWFGFYTGMRLREVLPLRWKRVDMAALVFRVEETKTGAPLELPVTRQLARVLEHRFGDSGASSDDAEDWVFPSSLPGALGHIADLSHHYRRIGEAGGTRFWYHGLRNCFITVAERDLLLPPCADQAAGEPRTRQRHHRGLRRRLDDRATAPARAAHRRPNRISDAGIAVSKKQLLAQHRTTESTAAPLSRPVRHPRRDRSPDPPLPACVSGPSAGRFHETAPRTAENIR